MTGDGSDLKQLSKSRRRSSIDTYTFLVEQILATDMNARLPYPRTSKLGENLLDGVERELRRRDSRSVAGIERRGELMRVLKTNGSVYLLYEQGRDPSEEEENTRTLSPSLEKASRVLGEPDILHV